MQPIFYVFSKALSKLSCARYRRKSLKIVTQSVFYQNGPGFFDNIRSNGLWQRLQFRGRNVSQKKYFIESYEIHLAAKCRIKYICAASKYLQ